jgi:hypothetical protein
LREVEVSVGDFSFSESAEHETVGIEDTDSEKCEVADEHWIDEKVLLKDFLELKM